MKKVVLWLICFLPVVGMAQVNQLRLKSTLTGGAAKSLTSTQKDKTILIQQCVGQIGAVGSLSKGNLQLQQGFLTHHITLGRAHAAQPLADGLRPMVHPNPVSNLLNISFIREVEGAVGLVVFDLLGRLLLEKEFESARSMQLKVGHLQDATYILQVTAEGQKWARQFIKTTH